MRAPVVVVVSLVLSACSLLADPEGDVRAAVTALAETTGYAWETTARGRADPPRSGFRISLPRIGGARVEVQGRMERATYAEFVVLPAFPTLSVQVPVRTYRKAPATWVGFTPLGWLTIGEIHQARRTQPDDEVPFDGKSVRLSAIFSAVQNATTRLTPAEELAGLLADVARFSDDAGAIVGELKPAAAEALYYGTRGRRGATTEPVAGVVVFRLREGVVTEFEYRLWPLPSPTSTSPRPPAAAAIGWKTTLSGVGSTQVTPPREAFEKLER